MSNNPWDRPPLPSDGDESEDSTYAGVGRTLSQWESLESELSHIYAVFIGKLFKDEAYDQYYDEAKTSKQRIKSIDDAAAKFFQKQPDQATEGEFTRLIEATAGYADRRHEVAHGIVRPMQWYQSSLPDFAPPSYTPLVYCLVPPHYQRTWFQTNGMPRYVYTSKELAVLADKFSVFLLEAIKFRLSIHPL
jgi:hypothetical protein